ncbi:hypothetical protein AB0H07_38950 [Streptomyces sp. NPDC021354]|uniref:hypothetical protein n=1 Tax=Streptomyces sp. NPDC021354 TaxID=3154793 RepID=UPI0033D1F610
MSDLEWLQDRDDDLAVGRAANRELMAQFNRGLDTPPAPPDETPGRRPLEYVGMARRSGQIPRDIIRDDTQIAVDAPPFFTGPEDFWTAMDSAVDDYRVDRQAGQPLRLELWCETAVLYPVTVVARCRCRSRGGERCSMLAGTPV